MKQAHDTRETKQNLFKARMVIVVMSLASTQNT